MTINTVDTTECDADSDAPALRYNNGKTEWGLVHFQSLEVMVKVLKFGAEKYSVDNWKKRMERKKICESLLRHVFAYMDGEDIDSESNLPHTGHILCNAMFLEFHRNKQNA